MRHKLAGRKLGRSSAHRKALFRNLVTDLLNYEKITSLGKKGGLNSRRQALAYILDEKIAAKVFNELAPRYAERPGGYTRIIKLGPRLGDGASMVRIELVE